MRPLRLLTALLAVSLHGWGKSGVSAAPGVSESSAPSSSFLASLSDFLDFDNLPETRFSCEAKVIGGYYADEETGCQMFHVCTIGQKGEVMDIKFLCLNGTVFDQETRVCERVDEVDCSKTEGFYDLNLELYGAQGFSIHQEEVAETSTSTTTSSTTTSTTTTTTTPPPPPPPTPTNVLQFPSSSPGAVALLSIHNTFNGLPSSELRPPPTPPTYTLRQQQHPHGVAHHYFSNSPRPHSFHPQYNYFGRNIQQNIQQSQATHPPTVIATSRSVTRSVSIPGIGPSRAPVPAPKAADEEYDADYVLDSFFKDVPRLHVARSSSVSVSTSSSSSSPVIVPAPAGGLPRKKRQSASKRGRSRSRSRTTEAPATTEAATTLSPPVPTVPETSFSCADKIPGGFYADVEADCTVFHICSTGRHNRINDHRFLCGVGTRFDQTSRTCVAREMVRCSQSESLYYLNDHFLPQTVPASPEEAAGTGFESKRIGHRARRATSQNRGPPKYTLSTLPAESRQFSCPEEDGNYADYASNCQAYHSCTNNQHTLHICPHLSVFNEALGVCDSWDSVECELYSDSYYDSQKTKHRTKRNAPRFTLDSLPKESRQFSCPHEDGLYGDVHSDCQAYHQCDQRHHTLHLCPHPSVFNEALGVCDNYENVDCELYSQGAYQSHKTRRQKRAAPKFTLQTLPEESRHFSCPEDDGLYADVHSDCQAYHQCDLKHHTLHICPHPRIFNQALGVCDSYENVDCELFAQGSYHSHKTRRQKRNAPKYSLETLPPQSRQFTCPEDDGLYSDVHSNCQAYHECEQNQHVLRLCPHPSVFNEALGVCDNYENVDCELFSRATYHSHKTRRQKRSAPKYSLKNLPAESREFVCPHEDGYFADVASNCQAYHQCDHRQHTLHLCQHPTVFNEALGVCDSWENVDCELYSQANYHSHKTGKRSKRSVDCYSVEAGKPIPDTDSNCSRYHMCVHKEGELELTKLTLRCAQGKIMDATQRRCVPGDQCVSNYDKPRKNKKTPEKYKSKKNQFNKNKETKQGPFVKFTTSKSPFQLNKSKDVVSKNSPANPSSKSLISSKNRRWLFTGPSAPSMKSILLNSRIGRIKRSTMLGLQKMTQFTNKNIKNVRLTSIKTETVVDDKIKSKITPFKDLSKKPRVKRSSNTRYTSRVRKPNIKAAILDADSESLEELLELRAALRRNPPRRPKYEYEDEDYESEEEEPVPRRRKRPHYKRKHRPVYDEYVDESEEPDKHNSGEEYDEPETENISSEPENLTEKTLAITEINTEKLLKNPVALNQLLVTLLMPSVQPTLSDVLVQPLINKTESEIHPAEEESSEVPPANEGSKVSATEELDLSKEAASSASPAANKTETKGHSTTTEVTLVTTEVPEETTTTLPAPPETTTPVVTTTTQKPTTTRNKIIRRIPTPVPTTTLMTPVIRKMALIREPAERKGRYGLKRGRNRVTSTTEAAETTTTTEASFPVRKQRIRTTSERPTEASSTAPKRFVRIKSTFETPEPTTTTERTTKRYQRIKTSFLTPEITTTTEPSSSFSPSHKRMRIRVTTPVPQFITPTPETSSPSVPKRFRIKITTATPETSETPRRRSTTKSPYQTTETTSTTSTTEPVPELSEDDHEIIDQDDAESSHEHEIHETLQDQSYPDLHNKRGSETLHDEDSSTETLHEEVKQLKITTTELTITSETPHILNADTHLVSDSPAKATLSSTESAQSNIELTTKPITTTPRLKVKEEATQSKVSPDFTEYDSAEYYEYDDLKDPEQLPTATGSQELQESKYKQKYKKYEENIEVTLSPTITPPIAVLDVTELPDDKLAAVEGGQTHYTLTEEDNTELHSDEKDEDGESILDEHVHDDAGLTETNHNEPVATETDHDEATLPETNHNEPVVTETVHYEATLPETNHNEPVVTETVHYEATLPETNHNEPVATETDHDQTTLTEHNHDVTETDHYEATLTEHNHDESPIPETDPNEAILTEHNRVSTETNYNEPLATEHLLSETVLPDADHNESFLTENNNNDTVLNEHTERAAHVDPEDKVEHHEPILHGYEGTTDVPDPANTTLATPAIDLKPPEPDADFSYDFNKEFEYEYADAAPVVTEQFLTTANDLGSHDTETTFPPQTSEAKLFTCTSRDMFKFHADPFDCHVFHYCSPGFHSKQILDFRFQCVDGTAFDIRTQSCKQNIKCS